MVLTSSCCFNSIFRFFCGLPATCVCAMLQSQISEMKSSQTQNSSQLRSLLLDPSVNLVFLRLTKEMDTCMEKLKEAQNEFSAWKFTADRCMQHNYLVTLYSYITDITLRLPQRTAKTCHSLIYGQPVMAQRGHRRRPLRTGRVFVVRNWCRGGSAGSGASSVGQLTVLSGPAVKIGGMLFPERQHL